MEKAEDIISALFNNGSSDHQAFVRIHKNWRGIVGDERLADHCRPEDLDEQSIRISFDHPGWIQTFKMNQNQILKRLNAQYPELDIRSMTLYLKDDKKAPAPMHRPAGPVEPEDKTPLKGDFNAIRDDDLKKRLLNLKKKMENK